MKVRKFAHEAKMHEWIIEHWDALLPNQYLLAHEARLPGHRRADFISFDFDIDSECIIEVKNSRKRGKQYIKNAVWQLWSYMTACNVKYGLLIGLWDWQAIRTGWPRRLISPCLSYMHLPTTASIAGIIWPAHK